MVSRALLLLLLAVPLPTAPTRYVSDPANLLEDGRENALNERLAQYERETSNQLLVYVDRRLPEGTTLEEMGAEAIRTWKVGQEKKDNGAILFFFVDDRESRIEVGYGLEGTLTDARSKRILVGLRDDLRAGDYVSAAERGAEQIIATIADPTDPPLTPQPVVQEARAAEPNTMNGSPLPFYLAVFAFLGVILVVWYKVRHSEEESRGLPHLSLNLGGGDTSSSSSDDWSSSSSDSSSSSSSSSDFSGGGGSGGGGGASDRW
jgi:uncharacterized protein